MPTQPIHRSGAILDSDVDTILEHIQLSRDPAEGSQSGCVFQTQPVVDARYRESTLSKQGSYLPLEPAVACPFEESATEERHDAGFVGTRIIRTVEIQIKRRVSLYKVIGLLCLCKSHRTKRQQKYQQFFSHDQNEKVRPAEAVTMS